MLLTAVICLFIATLILAVSSCFVLKNKSLSFLLKVFSIVSLTCLAIVCANFKNNFSGYAIFIILACLPQLLTLFDLKGYLETKKEALKQAEIEKSQPKEVTESDKIDDFDSFDITELSQNEEKPKKEKKSNTRLLESNGTLLCSIAFLLTSVCFGLSALYIGKETFYGLLLGVALAFAMTFLLLIRKKEHNIYDTIGMFLIFLSIGIILGQTLIVLLYSFDLTNILFCLGMLVYGVYIVLDLHLKSRFDHLAYFVAIMLMLITLIV